MYYICRQKKTTMKKIVHLLLITVLFFANSYGQRSLWTKVSNERLAGLPKMERLSMPRNYQLFSLDVTAFKAQLQLAPLDSENVQSNIIIAFPNPDGLMENYRIYESPIMEPGLAIQFPDMKTYSGKGITDPTASMRFSITQFGLHTMTQSGNDGANFIDTYTQNLANYIVYRKADVANPRNFECHVNETRTTSLNGIEGMQRNSDSNFRVYRLAVACTGEYATFHGGTAAAAQAAIVVTVNRVNQIYERDLSVRLVLVATNNLVIFTNPLTDPFNNNNAGTLINQSQTQITNRIGVANFDIGHTVSTGGGGLAGLGVVCIDGQKASGITGSSAPVGDPYDIDYVAHEMGHQFGCNHTFNGDQGSCGGGNRNDGTAVEPGSGTTVMAYAGICGSQDVQPNSDAHFSFISIAEAEATILGSATCATITPNGNFPPVVNAGLDYTIPNGTAFILKGAATDANGDALTYCWEQTNNQVSTQPPVQTATGGPNFRSRLPIASPDRYMPVLSSVIANNLAPTWEVIPTVARTMNFALTVRDNRAPNGGQTGRDDMVVTTAAVGPFLVSTPNTAVSWIVGTNETVTWSVAGTTANGINATFVDVLLSTDGGNTYPILLASKVPNDGIETVTVPNNVGTTNRVMVRGYKHIFYDISNTNFTIAAPVSSFAVAFSGVEEEQNKSACQGPDVSYNISYSTLGGFNGITTFIAAGAPAGSTVTFTPATATATGTVVMTVSNTNLSPAGLYTIIVSATSGVTKTVPFYFQLYSSVFPAMALTSPTNNATNQSVVLSLNWAANSNATSYDVQVATDAGFTNIISSGNVLTTSYNVSGLSNDTDYYWRVLPKNNNCSGTYSSTYTFRTGVIVCATTASANVPLAISATGTPTITSTLNIPSGVTISDINVIMNVTHTWINDLTATLTSPVGTVISLFANQCSPSVSVNNIIATFDDAGVAVVCGNNPGISGTVIPAQSLSAFNGQSSTGTWTLTITDAFNQDGGSLNSWSLNICGLAPLSVNENTLENFAVYPNPSNGNFTVQFNSNSTNDIKIGVHDMRGRQIFDKVYQNSGVFNQNIQLNNLQSGVYLVSVQDGDTKEVKRIIIE
jgi:subtilisin-like proprotein convertase family protein